MASPVHCVTASSSRTDQSRILRPFAPLLSGQARHLPHAFTTLIGTMSRFAIYHAHLLQFPSRNHLGRREREAILCRCMHISKSPSQTPPKTRRALHLKMSVVAKVATLTSECTSESGHDLSSRRPPRRLDIMMDGCAEPSRSGLPSPHPHLERPSSGIKPPPHLNVTAGGRALTRRRGPCSARGRPAALAGVSVLASAFGTIGVVPGPRCPAKFYVLCPPHPLHEPHRVVGCDQGVRRMGGCAGLLRRSFCRACVQPTCSMTMGADTDTDQEQVQASPYASTTIDGGDGPKCHIYGAAQPATQYDESRGHEDLGLGICGDRSEGP
ncbi:hypothetical protein V8D89_007987 [Ganoderma adspersum]